MPVARGSKGVSADRAVAAGGVIPGDRRRTGSGHIDSYGDGRVCRVRGCGTRLSRYNRAAVCWIHEEGSLDHRGPTTR
jgi:hypothetical protein